MQGFRGLFALFMLVVLPAVAQASHFRYGALRWQALANQPKPDRLKVRVTLELALRRGFAVGKGWSVKENSIIQLGDDVMTFGDGSQTFIDRFLITVSRTADDVIMGSFEVNHEFMKGDTYQVVYNDCCRLKELNNNADGNYNLQMTVDPSLIRSCVSSFVPIVEVGNTGKQHIEMVAMPADHDYLVWSLADGDRMSGVGGGAVQPSSEYATFHIVEDTGKIEWTTDGFALGLYTTQVLVASTNQPQITVPIDFFILVSEEKNLCVDACDNQGEACNRATGNPCTGFCRTINYGKSNPCMRNARPQINAPIEIHQYVDTEVKFDVWFEPNTFYEEYQHLYITTGTIPRGATWEWWEKGNDRGHGTITIPAEMNHNPIEYVICFIAYDGYMHGLPYCTGVEIVRHPPPAVVAPAEMHSYVEEESEFVVHFHDTYGGDFHQLLWVVTGEFADCVEFHTEDGNGYGHLAEVVIPYECSYTPMDFAICFKADDKHEGADIYGPESCTHVMIEARPLGLDCFGLFKTLEECSTEPLCFWDKDGLDEHHDPGPTGCYPYHECKSMHGTKEACIGHLYCHYAAFDMCLLSHHDAMPFNNKYNYNGDKCRRFSKKECREVDGEDRRVPGEPYGVNQHCMWDNINNWCVAPELHMPHSDECRTITSKAECKKSARNGHRCNWRRNYGDSHGPNDSPGKCIGQLQPQNDNDDSTDLHIINNPASNLDFRHFDFEHKDWREGLFVHEDHHFETKRENQYMIPNGAQREDDHGAIDSHMMNKDDYW